MQKITPHLWYDKEAKEAGDFYISIFKDSKHKDTTTIHNTPSGSVDVVTIELMGQEFSLISAGPLLQVQSFCILSGRVRLRRSGRCGMEKTFRRRQGLDGTRVLSFQ